MIVELSVYGAFREFVPGGRLALDVANGGTLADLRRAVGEFASANWPGFRPGLLSASAFASEQAVLRDADAIPADGRVALLPPVSGG